MNHTRINKESKRKEQSVRGSLTLRTNRAIYNVWGECNCALWDEGKGVKEPLNEVVC